MAKTKVTNLAAGPRGVIVADGTTHWLDVNESAELDLHPDHELYEGIEKGDAPAKKAAAAKAEAKKEESDQGE